EPGRDRLDLVEDRGPGRVDRVALVTERRGGFDRARELDHALAAFRDPLGLDDLDVPGIAEAPDGLRLFGRVPGEPVESHDRRGPVGLDVVEVLRQVLEAALERGPVRERRLLVRSSALVAETAL